MSSGFCVGARMIAFTRGFALTTLRTSAFVVRRLSRHPSTTRKPFGLSSVNMQSIQPSVSTEQCGS